MDFTNAIQSGCMQGVIFYPLVLSLALSYRLLKFPDITIEGTFALGGAVFAIALSRTNNYFVAIPLAVFCAAIAGAITASLHYYLKINKFLAGIIVVTGLYSVIIRILGGSNASLLRFNLNSSYLYISFTLSAIVLTVFTLLFYKSGKGIQIRGSASNPELSLSFGRPAGRLLVLGLAINNGIAAISSIYFSQDSGFTDVKIGQGTLITALAALAIGERLIPRKKISVLAYVISCAAVGSIFYQVLWAFALQLNIQPSDLKILSAIVVIVLFALKRRNANDDEL